MPDAKKVEKGRTPARAYVVNELTDRSRRYSLDQLPEIEVHAVGTVVVPAGEIPLVDLVRAGLSDELIAGVLLNPKNKIAASVLEKRKAKHYAFRQIASARVVVGNDWPDVTQKGAPRATMRNAIVAIQRLGIVCEFDFFHNRKIVGGYAVQEYAGELTDDLCARLRRSILDELGFDPRKEHVQDALNTLSLDNTYHPVRDYLDRLEWDGQERIEQFLIDCMGAPKTRN